MPTTPTVTVHDTAPKDMGKFSAGASKQSGGSSLAETLPRVVDKRTGFNGSVDQPMRKLPEIETHFGDQSGVKQFPGT